MVTQTINRAVVKQLLRRAFQALMEPIFHVAIGIVVTILQHINILKFRASDELQEGAIVETEEVFYFIGFTFAPIASKAKNILGVSLDAPVFQENEGKKKGDDLILGNTKQKILNIY